MAGVPQCNHSTMKFLDSLVRRQFSFTCKAIVHCNLIGPRPSSGFLPTLRLESLARKRIQLHFHHALSGTPCDPLPSQNPKMHHISNPKFKNLLDLTFLSTQPYLVALGLCCRPQELSPTKHTQKRDLKLLKFPDGFSSHR